MAAKKPTNFRLSETCQNMLERLSNFLGITKSAVIELAVRDFDETKMPADPPNPPKESTGIEDKPRPKPKGKRKR